ncbi:MAG TPA: AI-2E family transporter [Terriglobales bacterium]|nr:AI-2E family transporter [Terriglobales bacterium]
MSRAEEAEYTTATTVAEHNTIQTELSIAAPSPEGPRPRHWALNVIGVAVVLGICYYAESVLVVLLFSILLSFVLAPVVDLLTRMHLPRALASGIAVLLLLGLVGGVVNFSYNQAANLAEDLPKYTGKIQDQFSQFRKKAESLQVLNPQHEKGVLNVRPATDWGNVLSQGFGSMSYALLAGSFVPFLVYFMLSWHHHVRSSTVMLFRMEHRQTAYVALGMISAMIRSFMVGNLLIGLFLGAVSTFIFWLLHVPFFYFVGFISGFLSLVPYLGVVLAIAPPLFVGMEHLSSQDMFAITIAVVALHLVALNILYPKFLGNRMQLNPLAVTMALLLWAWLWGAMGLLLAVPITAAMKIIFDHVESLKPYGAWLGE